MVFAKLKNIYENHYKALMIFPMLLVVLAMVQIGVQYATTGDFVQKGVSLKGGVIITATNPQLSSNQMETALQANFPKADISVRKMQTAGNTRGFVIEADAQSKEEIAALLVVLEKEGLEDGEYSLEIVGSSLGEGFFQQTLRALGVAFLLITIVVFAYFRVPIPCLAVLAAAISDMVVTLAIFNVLGMKLSSAGVAAFLMLIGYSIDSDMLLTARALRRLEQPLMQRIYSSIRTGLTMTGTTLAAVLITLLLVNSDVVRQIMIVLLIGLLVDTVMTWIQNVGILRWYLERQVKSP